MFRLLLYTLLVHCSSVRGRRAWNRRRSDANVRRGARSTVGLFDTLSPTPTFLSPATSVSSWAPPPHPQSSIQSLPTPTQPPLPHTPTTFHPPASPLSPESVDALRVRAGQLLRSGNVEEALSALRSAAAATTSPSVAMMHGIAALERIGRVENRGLATSPKSRFASRHLLLEALARLTDAWSTLRRDAEEETKPTRRKSADRVDPLSIRTLRLETLHLLGRHRKVLDEAVALLLEYEGGSEASVDTRGRTPERRRKREERKVMSDTQRLSLLRRACGALSVLRHDERSNRRRANRFVAPPHRHDEAATSNSVTTTAVASPRLDSHAVDLQRIARGLLASARKNRDGGIVRSIASIMTASTLEAAANDPSGYWKQKLNEWTTRYHDVPRTATAAKSARDGRFPPLEMSVSRDGRGDRKDNLQPRSLSDRIPLFVSDAFLSDGEIERALQLSRAIFRDRPSLRNPPQTVCFSSHSSFRPRSSTSLGGWYRPETNDPEWLCTRESAAIDVVKRHGEGDGGSGGEGYSESAFLMARSEPSSSRTPSPSQDVSSPENELAHLVRERVLTRIEVMFPALKRENARYPTQILRYAGATHGYDFHTDCTVGVHPADGGMTRAYTALLYLTTVSDDAAAGGADSSEEVPGSTLFPLLGNLAIRAIRGRLAVFSNSNPSRCDPLSVHASAPLSESGGTEKWVIQQFYSGFPDDDATRSSLRGIDALAASSSSVVRSLASSSRSDFADGVEPEISYVSCDGRGCRRYGVVWYDSRQHAKTSTTARDDRAEL